MTQSTAPRLRFQFFQLRHRAVARPELGLDGILPEAMVQQVLKQEGASWKRVFYTPWLTFWAFFWQVLSPDRSCRAAVKRIAAWMARRGEADRRRGHRPVLQGPGSAPRSGAVAVDASPGPRGARGGARGVAVVRPAGQGGRRHDGQHARHRGEPGASTPRAPRSSRGWGSRSRGWWSSSAWRPGWRWRRPSASTRGSRLARMPCFAGSGTNTGRGDVSLGDRDFGSYFDIALLKRRGVDSVCRLHQARISDFRWGGGWARRTTSSRG